MNQAATNDCQSRSSFWPQLLVAVSVMIFLGWQLSIAVQQRRALQQLAGQQAVLTSQAAQIEGQFQSMMTELVRLSATDPYAKAIVVKYRIAFNPAPQAALPPAPAPAPVPPR